MIHLFVEWYDEKQAKRRAELEECLHRNLDNPAISKVILLTRDGYLIPGLEDKIRVCKIHRRATYADFFREINATAEPGTVSIIANSDICFDDTLPRICALKPDECFALSRWEPDPLALWDRADSQDAWAFNGEIRAMNGSAEIELGKPGCDNRIARVLSDAGYKVLNPAKDIRGIHLHASGVRHYQRNETVAGPYLLVPPTSLDGFTRKERVLHVALNYMGDKQPALRRALESLGEYREFDWIAEEKAGPLMMRSKLLNLARDFVPTVTFMQIQRDGLLERSDVACIPGLVFNWTGDVRQPTQNLFSLYSPFSIGCFSNEAQAAELRAKGARAEYLQIGFDDTVYTPKGPPMTCPEIVFMGNDYGTTFPLSAKRWEMAVWLTNRYGSRFGVFGKFPGAVGNFSYDKHAEAAVYRGCKIAINLSQFELERYSSDRLLRGMGSGAFMLSHHYPGIEKDFTPGIHLETWKDFEELTAKIDRYLVDPQRKTIAEAGCSRVHLRHSWQARVTNDLTKLIGKYRQ